MSFLQTQKFKDLRFIIARNVFVFTNGILFAVIVLLFVFGDTTAALFLGGILTLSMVLGLAQDIRAWLALENLQLLTAPHVRKINDDKTETLILVETLVKGDYVKIKTGDQIPGDGTLIETDAIELSEGLITGESASTPRTVGDKLLAGSIITSGSGVMRIDSIFNESRIARMTEGIKTYSIQMSPIQQDVATLITYSSYILVPLLVFVFIRGSVVHESTLIMIKNIGALASIVVPQGLAFAMTLLFAYGAAQLFNRNILLQEINATEKLGRIRNLCMDKTGTLTENILRVESMEVPPGNREEDSRRIVQSYLHGTKDTSQMMSALTNFLGTTPLETKVVGVTPFSSWRSFGALKIENTIGESSTKSSVIIAGAPESILPHVHRADEKAWLQPLLDTQAMKGKRIFCVAESLGTDLVTDLVDTELKLTAIFIIGDTLRSGIKEAIDFFQKRNVCIRIISGDNPLTVCSIATAAGVDNAHKVITGKEMESWSHEDFVLHTKEYVIFARTLPEQKEKIIEALKLNGFTAMVGDGANDALALKKADLGIAMFDGATASKQVASIVLMNNSFTALPGGVTLADSIIKNAEIFASIFLYPACSGLFLFIIISVLGYPFPITPLNVTLINYFTVGIPGILISYWTLYQSGEAPAPSQESFLGRIVPFIAISSLLQACIVGIVFYMSPENMRHTQSNILVVLTLIFTGFIFFIVVTKKYRTALLASQKRELWYLTLFEIALLCVTLYVPFLAAFFEIPSNTISFTMITTLSLSLVTYTALQILIKKISTTDTFVHLSLKNH